VGWHWGSDRRRWLLRSIAHKFAKEGASVVVNGLADDPIEEVVNAIRHYSGKAIPYAGDVSEEFHAQNCVQTAINAYGKLDILVNNALRFSCHRRNSGLPR
jgi:NAD(P)-dependent dehydrogenase (short-subunit alcohol dehydrogenase family)